MFVIVNSYVAFCCTVIDIFWESTLVFFVTYKPADSGSTEQPWLVQVTLAVSKQILPLLGRIACTECWDVACSYRCSVVCLMDTAMSPAKGWIEMLFGLWTQMGPRSRVSGVGSGSLGEGAVFLGWDTCKNPPCYKVWWLGRVYCRKSADLINMQFGMKPPQSIPQMPCRLVHLLLQGPPARHM